MSMKCRPHGEPPGVPCIRPPVPPEPERLRLPVMTVNGAGPDENGDVKVDLSGIGALGAKVDSLGEAVSEETNRAVGAEAALSARIADLAETAGAKADKSALEAHVSRKDNPHAVTAEQVGAYTKGETDEKLDAKAGKATTLAGYGITDAAKQTDLEALAAKVDAANTALEEVA